MIEYLGPILAISAGIMSWTTNIRNFFQNKKSTSAVPKHGRVTDFKIPRKLKIGNWFEVSAVYEGSVESGFFSLKIIDCEGTEQWQGDNGSVEGRHLDSGEYIETGKLNFTNGRYEGRWKFRPEAKLKPGKGKAEVGMFEDRDFVSTDGKTMPHRPHIDLQEREIILY